MKRPRKQPKLRCCWNCEYINVMSDSVYEHWCTLRNLSNHPLVGPTHICGRFEQLEDENDR